MGNDGGSIPKRRELVKEAARNPNSTEVKETQQEQQAWQWSTCPLSHKPLIQPIVSDWLGKLYNKDAILEFLLPSESEVVNQGKIESQEILQGRVSGLRDIVEIKFQAEQEDGTKSTTRKDREHWICPVTSKRLGSQTKSVYLVPCGHAFSKSAIDESADGFCPQCNDSFTTDNVIPILPYSAADIDRLTVRASKLKEQNLSHSLKKASGSSKKRKKATEESKAGATLVNTNGNNAESRLSHSLPVKGAIKNAATASLTAKVLEDGRMGSKKRKMEMNENLKSLFSAGDDGKGLNQTGDFMSRGFTIPAGAKR